MAYRIAGRYVAACNCNLVCPCPYDGPPTGPDGQCQGLLVFDIGEGNLDGTDVGSTRAALYNHWPSNLTAGNWRVGLVVDDGASDDQARAIERIFSGQEGGPFGDFAAFISEYMGMARAEIDVSDGSASVSGHGDLTYEALTGGDGSPTMVRNAMFGFAPEFGIGKASGHATLPIGEVDFVYGESADFEFSSEMGEEVHTRA
jgi:hypothetical protein